MIINIDSKKNSVSLIINEEFIVSSPLYYYVIDNKFQKKEESFEKCVDNIQSIINKWISTVLKGQIGACFYFPFEYEDEYIGILKINIIEINLISISYCYSSDIAGYSISPSDFQNVKIDYANFQCKNTVKVMLDDFINVKWEIR